MKSVVFNNSIGSPYAFNYPQLTAAQNKEIIAGLFEQLLLFDNIAISTNRLNFGIAFLISQLGINTVQRLIESGYIKFLLWTPVIVTSTGMKQADGTIDESEIYGNPPIVAGSLSDDDKDPEKNIFAALSHFRLHKDRKKIFTKSALKSYIIPNGMEYSVNSTKVIIDAYVNNNLQDLGLPYEKEPDQLNVDERILLLDLGHKVLETAILSEYNMKSYDNYEHYAICKQNLKNIGKAYNVVNNTDILLNLEGVPNLKQLYLEEKIEFESIFKLRHLSTAKYYRKWINSVDRDSNTIDIAKEYLKEIKGNTNFFATTEGRFLRSISMYGANALLGYNLAGIKGAAASLSLGLLETFWVDSILKGKNPSMFIDKIKKEIESD